MKKLLFLLLIPTIATAAPRVVVDLETGAYKKLRGNYRLFKNAKKAQRKGFIEYKVPTVQPAYAFTGTNDKNTSPIVITKPVRINYTYTGDRLFSIMVRNISDGSAVELFANTIGSTKGTDILYDTGTFYLDVTGEGNWEIEVQ